MATRKKAARKVRKVARKRARATRKVARKVRKVAKKRARATRKVTRKVVRKRGGAARKAARKAARSTTAPPVRERLAPIARTAVAMPVAMSTKAPIRPEGLRPASLFDRDMPAHEED